MNMEYEVVCYVLTLCCSQAEILIAEGGVKHQKSNQSIIFYFMRTQQIENKQ
jgi:hypothetical protein